MQYLARGAIYPEKFKCLAENAANDLRNGSIYWQSSSWLRSMSESHGMPTIKSSPNISPRIHYLFSKYSNHISEQCFWLENQDTTPEINSYGNPPVYTVELGNWSIFQPGLIKPEGVWNPQLGLSKMFGEKLGEDKKKSSG